MNTHAGILSLILCVGLGAIVVSGCGKKSTDYENTSSSMKPEGHLLGGGSRSAVDIQEEMTAGDLESLDQTGVNQLAPDTSSDAYRKTYGRSTAPLYPVFFDFDSSSINADQLENLNSSGKHLLEEKGINIVIEGNCDERGTADYNLALGELRVLNVKKYLVNLGISENRLTTISFGSERPLYPGSNEVSWAMNRRADLIIP